MIIQLFVARLHPKGQILETVIISPDFQVEIPESVRKFLALEPGQKMVAMIHEGQLMLIPIRPVAEYRGILKGPVDFEREKTDRF